MKFAFLLCTAVLGITALPCQASEPLLALDMQVVEEKHDVVVTLEAGAAAELGKRRELNGLSGRTRDFQGQSLPLYAISDGSISTGRFLQLVQFPGRLSGRLQCRLVQVGSSPHLPAVKLGVLAQGCAIKQLNH